MKHLIDKSKWYVCKLCKTKISELAKQYGGCGIYYTQVFKKHLQQDHNIELNDYFTNRPKCPCGICKQNLDVIIKGSNFKYREYQCGRNPGVMKWAQEAKISRLGSGNPMYKETPWNKGLSKETNESIENGAKKRRGRTTPLKVRKKQSEAAKKRTVHGHTGCKHSKETREKLRQATLRNIKKGVWSRTKSKPHIAFCKLLKELDIKYEEEKIVDCWSFDIYLTEYNIYIEVDGDYFHSHPNLYPNGPKTKTQKINWYRDLKKNKYCKKYKLTLYRFWESDILNNPGNIKCKLKTLLTLKK